MGEGHRVVDLVRAEATNEDGDNGGGEWCGVVGVRAGPGDGGEGACPRRPWRPGGEGRGRVLGEEELWPGARACPRQGAGHNCRGEVRSASCLL